ncbi:MAG: response regulator [Deltaproteobacteria bacterium]|nr:MAG: response regulator [Deltaproteobacteria bacterium]
MTHILPGDGQEVEDLLGALLRLQQAGLQRPLPEWGEILALASDAVGGHAVWFRDQESAPWLATPGTVRPAPESRWSTQGMELATESRSPVVPAVHAALCTIARQQESDSRYAAVRDISFEGLCVHKDGHILEVNQALADLYGYTRDEMIGMNMTETVAPEVLPKILALVRSGYRGAYDTIARLADGTRLELEARGRNIEFAGEQVRVASFRDIRERKAAEAAREAAREAAEEANRQKSAFLANMSHELRTPLNAILGTAQLLERDGVSDRSLVSHLMTSAADLLALVDDLLDLSRIEEGRLKLYPEPFELHTIPSRVAATSPAPTAGVGLSVHIDEELADWYIGDARRIRQIVLNLLTNAVKFTREGQIRLSVFPRGDDVCFEVADTGIGIPPERLEQLFERFEQGSADHSYGGSGLGLHISRTLAEHMGGTLTARSEVGIGSTFTLRLPLDEASQRPTPEQPDPPTPVPQRTLHVLLAEDNAINQLVLERMIRSLGHEVTIVANGEEALAAVDGVDLVFMDLQMPVMDGIDATRALRKTHPGLPVIGLTAHAMPEDQVRCRRAGMVDVLTKPLNFAELRDALTRVS